MCPPDMYRTASRIVECDGGRPGADMLARLTERDFTGHTHADEWNLIHMNGESMQRHIGDYATIDTGGAVCVGDPAFADVAAG